MPGCDSSGYGPLSRDVYKMGPVYLDIYKLFLILFTNDIHCCVQRPYTHAHVHACAGAHTQGDWKWRYTVLSINPPEGYSCDFNCSAVDIVLSKIGVISSVN